MTSPATGMYYLAVSDLQRLQLNDDGSVVNPNVLGGDKPTSVRAIEYLNDSRKNFELALKVAEEERFGDEKGLSLLKTLTERTASLGSQLADKKIPELEEFHVTTAAVMEYTQYGIDISNKHLSMDMVGHGAGGDKYRLD